jgi:hypothetical protein
VSGTGNAKALLMKSKHRPACLPDKTVASKQGEDRESVAPREKRNGGRSAEASLARAAGSRVTILGITGDSFAEPDILLSAQVANDPGYFSERLSAAWRHFARAWQERSFHLEPTVLRTDILGALLVASQLFQDVTDGESMSVRYPC